MAVQRRTRTTCTRAREHGGRAYVTFVISSGRVELDAAETFFRFQPGLESSAVDRVDCGGEQAVVHAADEFGVLLGEAVKGAVAQDDGAVAPGLGFVAFLFEHAEHGPALACGGSSGAGRGQSRVDLVGHAPTLVRGDLFEGGDDVRGTSTRSFCGFGEHLTRKRVVAGRQAQFEVATGTSVELRRASRPGALTAGQALKVDLEQAVGGEPFEMVGGGAALEADG